ncbi:MAG: Tn3 family transposase [Gammaproteobacteria bacterium]|nr:Tn3 family transposase [Gammaproteobacteria bacterium]
MTQKHKLDEQILDSYTLLPPEIDLVGQKQQDYNRLAQAVFLKYFQEHSRFPEYPSDLPPNAIDWVADQLQISSELLARFDWQGRTAMRYRSQIRAWLGFRSSSLADQDRLRNWLIEDVLPDEFRVSHLERIAYQRLKEDRIEPPTAGRLKRLILSAIYQYEQGFFKETAERIPVEVKANLRQLVHRKREIALDEAWHEEHGDPLDYPIHELRADVGEAKAKTMKTVAARLKYLQEIALPEEVFADIPLRFLQQYAKQATLESLSHLQRHHDAQTITLLAAFCRVRQTQLTDQLVELLIQLLNTIRLRAKHRVERELLADFIRVGGKQQLLFRMATAIWDNPDGIIRDVLFPLIGKERLHQLVEEAKQSGNYYQSVQTRISGSYTYHYRQVLPDLLEVLQFRSNNNRYKPLIDALSVIIAYLHELGSHYPADEDIPLEGVIQKQWRSWIYQQDKHGDRRVRRVRYELCVLQTLREKLRCKEIWVASAERFRNPDEDVPADFADKREAYYQALDLPLDADEFIRGLQKEMQGALQHFNDALPDNPDVEILAKDDGLIRLTPLEKQDEPTNLRALKKHIRQRWWMTSLLDILKEVDDRVNFTAAFHNLTGADRLPKAELRKRLLLCLYALGTNAGLTSVSMGNHGVSYANLQYTRRHYIDRASLRQAVQRIVDETLSIRTAAIWGEDATWCASDSKQFAAWSQNLRTQWHRRYHRAGIMVYWHVTKSSLCIYSQLKAPSSSEVAAMIAGVLQHCTEQQVDRNYVDTHGQSEVGFAFCRLLGFQLMPRFKNLHKQRLHLAFSEDADTYPNLQAILGKRINWQLIREQYDEMVKYATALRLGTAASDAILKRFNRNNYQHPTYKALSELGRALKTIFLCNYLTDPAVRREIQEGLNVVESWNSANRFIFFGKQGEFSSNDIEAQEISILSLHLLQSSLVYINTLMTQEVLAQPVWSERMTQADWRGLTPLFHRHVNPYGSFDLNMDKRIHFELA